MAEKLPEERITDPLKLADRIERTTLADGYDKDDYPVNSLEEQYDRIEWGMILAGLRLLAAKQGD